MKRLLHIIAVLLFVSQYSGLYAQTENTEMRVSVCVGEERLENLLTDEQKDNVTHLTITGTMAEEDYACLHRMLHKKLIELNLCDADIDTIPAHALECDNYCSGMFSKRIILPSKLDVLRDSSLSLCIGGECKLTLILTGKFPKFGKCVFSAHDYIGEICFEIFPDNEFCKEEEGGIYSLDGERFYYHNLHPNPEGRIKILDGTKIINGGAFECRYSREILDIEIPESVDSIGDRVFAFYHTALITGYWPATCWPRIYCMAKMPPALGEDVFYFCQDLLTLIVPDKESIKLYRATEGWNWFKHIWAIDNIGGSGVEPVVANSKISVYDDANRYIISGKTNVIQAVLYDCCGTIIMANNKCGKVLFVDKKTLRYPYSILRICYEDGTNETVKLKP